ncbi:MAG: ATP-binding protein [Pseudomonadota bacterium]
MTSTAIDEPTNSLNEETWRDVIAAVDKTYSELVEYQERLETQNRELDEMRRFMSSVMASVSDLLIVVGPAMQIERTGGAIKTILGLEADPPIGESLSVLLDTTPRKILEKVITQVMEDRAPRVAEISFQTPAGPTPLEVSVSPRLDPRGRSRGAVLVGRPLGELRNAYRDLEESHSALQAAQAQLVQSEKLAALGRLVAGVAHELNNPISFVYANTHALEKYTGRFETYFEAVAEGRSREELVALREKLRLDKTVKNLREATEGAKDGAERVRDIVADLRRLSADGGGEAGPFDLVTTARIAADWVKRGTKTPVEFAFEGSDTLQAVGAAGPIQQIVMNLVQNALDALADTQAPCIILRVFPHGERAMLQVEDNGPGIGPEHALSIFDPFFTTKEVGKGTGLGLSISHKIAEDQDGKLRLVHTGAEGSIFELALPLNADGGGA